MNITKPAWRRPVAMACVGALAALGWTTVGDAAHAATDLPAAQFASVSGSGACAANEQAPADVHRHVRREASNDRAAQALRNPGEERGR